MNSVIFETARRDSEDKNKVNPLKAKSNFELSTVSTKNVAPYKLSIITDENDKSPVKSSTQYTENNLRGESSLSGYNKPNPSNTVRTPFKEVVSNTPLDDSNQALIKKSSNEENSAQGKQPSTENFNVAPKIFGQRNVDLFKFEDLNVIPSNSNKVQNSGYSVRGRRMDTQDEDVPDEEGGAGIQLQDSSLLHQSSVKRQQIITRI